VDEMVGICLKSAKIKDQREEHMNLEREGEVVVQRKRRRSYDAKKEEGTV
jgi:hypothetical protein